MSDCIAFAYCDFRHQGAAQMLMARAVARPRSLHAPANARSADASRSDITASVETPKVDSIGLDSVKPAAGAVRFRHFRSDRRAPNQPPSES